MKAAVRSTSSSRLSTFSTPGRFIHRSSEPFTPDNQLYYSSYQLQDNFTWDLGNHVLTFGFSGEKYHSKKRLFPASRACMSIIACRFLHDANAYLNGTTSTAKPALFQVRYNNTGPDRPCTALDVYYWGVRQDEYQATQNLKVTVGLRFDVPSFGATGLTTPMPTR